MTTQAKFPLSRRELLNRAACGFGSLALTALCAQSAETGGVINPLAPRVPHFAPRAKRIIFLWMQGGPSHVDLFENKPRLRKQSGDPLPFELPKTRLLTDSVKNTRLMGPLSDLVQRGQSGLYVSDWLPHLALKADELCLLSGMNTDSEAHAPAVRTLHTGSSVFVRPSMGAWATYGLGTENQNLPGFVTIRPDLFGDGGNPQLYGSAFLPAAYQGTPLGEAHPVQPQRALPRSKTDAMARTHGGFARPRGSRDRFEAGGRSFCRPERRPIAANSHRLHRTCRAVETPERRA